MPSKKSQDVFIVTHCVLDMQQDDKCGTVDVAAYSSADVANEAARALMEEITATDPTSYMYEDLDDDGLIVVEMCNDAGDTLAEVKVTKTSLLNSARSQSKSKATESQPAEKSKVMTNSNKRKPSASEDEDEDADKDELDLDEPVAKKTASSKSSTNKEPDDSRKQMAEGKYGALAGVKMLFTGTLQMDRATCKKTAEEYGAKVITKLEDTDYIVLGAKAGPKKLDVIRENDLETISEEEFLQLLQTGVPADKRARMAAKRAADEAEAPPKKKSKKA